MPFSFPTFADVLYRLVRLRKLIFCGVMFPVAVYVLVQLLWWLAVGQPVTGVLTFAFIFFVVVASHAILFPNAMAETATVSVALAILVVAAPLAGNSVLGWLVLLLIAAFVAVFGQNRLLNWQMTGPKSARVLRASVYTTAPKEQAITAFTMQPNRDEDDHRSGAPDADGVFPVFLKMHDQGIDEGLGPEFDEMMQRAARENADEIREEMEALRDQGAFDGPDVGELASMPSYWVEIIEETADYQKIRAFVPDEGLARREHGITEYKFTPAGKGWTVTETETVMGFEQGLNLGMWMTDFQKDRLIMIRDRLEQRKSPALRLQHTHGLLTLLGRAFMRRQLRANMRDGDHIDLN